MNINELPRPKKININHLPVMAKNQIDHAKLPQNYLAAKVALKECDRVDEVKDISDKHSAIAHYAKQIKDNSLKYYAERIYIRALHRIGELLSELPTGKERLQAGKALGLSQSDTYNAYCISHLDESDLGQLVDKTPPASKSTCMSEGWKKSEYAVRARARYAQREEWDRLEEQQTTPYEYCESMFDELLTMLERQGPKKCRRFSEALSQDVVDYTIYTDDAAFHLPDAMRWAQMLAPDEAAKARPVILKLIEWLDDFERGLRSPAKEKSS